MKKLNFSLLFLSTFLISKSHAVDLKKIKLNFGSHTEFYNASQINTSGDKNRFDLIPTIGAGISHDLPSNFKFLPEINWALPINQGSSQIIKNVFMLRADFGYTPIDWLNLRAGSSLMIQNQHGRGGKTQIENGNTVSTFYYPDENHSSFNNTFDLGVEFIKEKWSARIQTYTYSLFKEERREMSYTLFVSYLWER
jgi:hypothetical protein